MLNQDLHRLLIRQLRKSGIPKADLEKMEPLIKQVNSAYNSFDNDILHIENILEASSKELFKANQKLIKERDQTKAQVENIVDNVGGVIFETDLLGNFTYLNKAWTVYTGLTIEESIGKNYKDFLIGKNTAENIRLNQLFNEKKDKFKIVFKYENEEDKLIWFELKFALIRNEDRIPTGFIGTINDVTNLKEIEIKLQKASKAKDDFLSTMSHEIRTPLNAVTGLANILLMEDYLPDQLENLKALKYSGEHLLGLINDLLDFNKIESGTVKIVEEDFSLDYFLNNIHSHFKLRGEEKKLNFQVIKGKNVPSIIKGDRLKLTQVIKNLLSNAFKFTLEGSVILKVNCFEINTNTTTLEFMVSDTGIGVSAQRQKLIFESFMQANSTTSVKYGGTGLGLAISKKLLNMQDSDLQVKSKIGSGSTFYFRIVYKVSNRLDVFSPEMIKSQPNYKPLNLNVLVAEDNKMNVLILNRFFSKWHVNFEVAENGQELLEIYEKNDFDIILMDLQMPLLDGYETAKRIRKLPDKTKSSIPIIALTAFAQTDIKEKTQRYKMDDFMSKPFVPEKLYELLKRYCLDENSRKVG